MSDFGSAKESISPSESSCVPSPCTCMVCNELEGGVAPCYLEAETNCELGDTCVYAQSGDPCFPEGIECARQATIPLGAASPAVLPWHYGFYDYVPNWMNSVCSWMAYAVVPDIPEGRWWRAIAYGVFLWGGEYDFGGGTQKYGMLTGRIMTVVHDRENPTSDIEFGSHPWLWEGEHEYYSLDAHFLTDIFALADFDCETDFLGEMPQGQKTWTIDGVEYDDPEVCPDLTFTVTGIAMDSLYLCDPCDESSS